MVSTAPWSASGPASARSCTCILKPAVLPRPSTGGAPNATTTASWTCRNCARRFAATTEADWRACTRSSNGARITNMPPAFEMLLLVRMEYPGRRIVCATPGVARTMSSSRAIHPLVQPIAEEATRADEDEADGPQRRRAPVRLVTMSPGREPEQALDASCEEEVGGQGAEQHDRTARQRLVALLAVRVGFDQGDGTRRSHGHRVDRRDDGRGGDGERELPVELPADPGDERGRDEHRAQHEGDRDHRAGD